MPDQHSKAGSEKIFDQIMHRLDSDHTEELLQAGYELGRAREYELSPETSDTRCLKIYVLGTTKVRRYGHELELEEALDAYTLLALLASRMGRPVPIREVNKHLWSGSSDEVAFEKLSVVVSQLSQSFGAGLSQSPVLIEGRSIRLNLGDLVWLDAVELVEAASSPDPMRRARALSLYRAEPFADFPYDSWTLLPREHLRDVFVTLARVEADRYCEQGNQLRAAELLTTTLDTEPFEEDIYCEAITINLKIGRVTAAVRQARKCREMLANLGTLPSPSFQRLEEKLKPYESAAPKRF